jgi:hypothetical protein
VLLILPALSFVRPGRFLWSPTVLIRRHVGFVRTKRFDYLAGVLLALTGSEVMYAKYGWFDIGAPATFLTFPSSLGQFNALSIRVCF